MRKVILYFDPSVKTILTQRKNKAGEVKTVLSSVHNFAAEGETVAAVVDVKGDEEISTYIDPAYTAYKVMDYFSFNAGQGIYFDDTEKVYKASYYGFIVLVEKKIQILSPLVYAKDKLRAYFNVFPSRLGQYPPYLEVDELLRGENVIYIISKEDYEKQVSELDPALPRLVRVLVAEGRDPVNGYDDYYEPLINFEKKAGKILSDGRIDFKEVDSIIQVQKNQEILLHVLGRKQEDGYDVFGEKIPAIKEPPKGYRKGDNLVQSGFDDKVYLAGIDGCVKNEKNKISVLPVAMVNGDIDLDSGNIDFNGTVHITGSVKPGFRVKAASDIIIEKDVEDAQLIAGGNISVKLGVVGVGKESVKLIAGGEVKARFMQNAMVEAMKSVIVEDSIINCEIISYDSIIVNSPTGKIIGGKLTALNEVSASVIGTQNETTTSISVGRNYAVEKELTDKRSEIKIVKDKVDEVNNQLKMQFGDEIFKNPKEYIKILPPVKKKNCLLLLNDLSNANRDMKKLIEESKEIEARNKPDKEPFIKVSNKIFGGVVLNVKKSVKKIEKPIENVKFFEDPMEKAIRITTAE